MNALLLKLGGCVALAAAVVAGMSENSHSTDPAVASPESHSRRSSRAVERNPVTKVPVRSAKSRNTDVSMATRMHRVASETSFAGIQPGKSINITISNVPEEDRATINDIYPVSDSGSVNLPFIGTVQAAGLSGAELADVLQSRYRSAGIYRNPTISVFPGTGCGPAEVTVNVGNQVRTPGPVPFVANLTLFEAIQAVGGPTEFGSMKRVILTRDGRQKIYDLTQEEFRSIPLQRKDCIDVPQKTFIGR